MAASGRDAATVGRSSRYEVLGHIANGGMAELKLARAVGIEGFEKLVVLKRILPHLANNRDFVEMFLDEARIAATLQHSNIVQVYDIGALDGDYFFAMEYLHGEDVREIRKAAELQQKEIPLEHSISIILGVCAALDYAHNLVGNDGLARGIIHRDVSPQNVLVTYEGGVKLVDFGIAKAAHRLTETRAGTLKGKVQYMSPEQCTQEPLDARSDVFAVAIMLWELTCGTQLYPGKSEFEILKSVIERDARSPSSVRPGYPARLEQIVMKGLRRDREERYQSAQALQVDLEAFARDERLAVSALGLKRFMRELFGERIDAFQSAQRKGEQALVQQVIDAIDLRTGMRTPDESLAPPLVSDTISEKPRTRALAAKRSPRGRGAVVGAAVLLGAALAGGAVMLSRRGVGTAGSDVRSDRPVAPPAAPAAPVPTVAAPVVAVPVPAPPVEAPAPPQPISVKVRRTPAQAQLFLDGVAVRGDEVTFERDDRRHELRVVAAGYLTQTQELDAHSPPVVTVSMRRRSVEHPRKPSPSEAKAPPAPAKKATMTPLDP